MECMEVERKNEVAKERNNIKIQKNYYKETFRFIDEALKLEDQGKEQEAILCYNKSLRSIANGVKISIQPEEVTLVEFEQYESIKEKLSKAQQEVLHRLEALNDTDPMNTDTQVDSHPVNMEAQSNVIPSERNNEHQKDVVYPTLADMKESPPAYQATQPTAPPASETCNSQATQPTAPPASETCNSGGALSAGNEGNKTWHDTKELINIEEGVRLFHVNGTEVSTWTSHCALQVFQIIKQNLHEISPPAFLKCGEWMFPMEPGQSPVLKSAHRTYMFPDMADSGKQVTDPSALPCVGIILADFVPDALVGRFERVLSLYCDFRKEIIEQIGKEKPQRPPPPVMKEKDGASKPSSSHMKESRENKLPSQTVAISDVETITAEPGVADDPATIDQSSLSAAITKGIHIGSQWISWGFIKGSEYASNMVEKGSTSLQKRIKPNQESSAVSPEVSRNIRQLHQTTGSVVQISSFLASTLGTLIINLGKNLAPLVVSQGQKMLPDKYKVENNEKTQNAIDNAKKVAVAGLQGFSLVFLSLEQSGKHLYKSISKAAVETMQHKYGDQVGDVTSDAMGAAGNTAQVIWNVRKLGPKAIAKRTAKETGKAMIEYDDKDNPYASYHKNGVG